MTMTASRIALFTLLLTVMFSTLATAQLPGIPANDPIRVNLLSSETIETTAGQIITVNAAVSNTGNETASGIAYISIVDEQAKIPVDLEDWSAQKGIHLQDIRPGQSIPTQWSVRLVKSGTYTVAILFSKEAKGGITDSSPPAASSRTVLIIAPKINLNPNNVLPVAFGMPLLLVIIVGVLHYRRGRSVGMY